MATPMPTSNPIPSPSVAMPLKAPTIVVLGEPGAGKTHSLITLLLAGIEVFVIVTDPSGLDTILDQIRAQPNAPDLMKKFHYANVSPVASGWKAMQEMGEIVGKMGYEDIAKLKQGIGKGHIGTFMTLLSECQDFVCDHCGGKFGDVTSWDDSRALVIDSLSGVNKIMKDQTVGYKPSMHQGEWGIAMNLEEQFIFTLASDLRCYFVITAHLDKSVNEITGLQTISMAALGNKLAPQLLKLFSEVVLAKRVGKDFYWSTQEMNMAVKNRALPIGDKLPPSFAPIVEAHKRRKAMIGI